MISCWYIVIKSCNFWWVDCEGKAYGPFNTASDARLEAAHIAKVFGDPTRQIRIYAPNEDGRLELMAGGSP